MHGQQTIKNIKVVDLTAIYTCQY